MLVSQQPAMAVPLERQPVCTASFDRVPRAYLWHLFVDDVSPWEVAELCRNVVAAQEGQPDTTKRVKRA